MSQKVTFSGPRNRLFSMGNVAFLFIFEVPKMSLYVVSATVNHFETLLGTLYGVLEETDCKIMQ